MPSLYTALLAFCCLCESVLILSIYIYTSVGFLEVKLEWYRIFQPCTVLLSFLRRASLLYPSWFLYMLVLILRYNSFMMICFYSVQLPRPIFIGMLYIKVTLLHLPTLMNPRLSLCTLVTVHCTVPYTLHTERVVNHSQTLTISSFSTGNFSALGGECSSRDPVGGGRILRKNSSYCPRCPQVGKPVPLFYIRYYVTFLLFHLSWSGLLLQIFVVDIFGFSFIVVLPVLFTGKNYRTEDLSIILTALAQ